MDKWTKLYKSFLAKQDEEEIANEVIGTDWTVTKDLLMAFGGPTAYLRFEFNLNGRTQRCCKETLCSISYHSNEIDYGKKTEWRTHHYTSEEEDVLWDKYGFLVEDYDD